MKNEFPDNYLKKQFQKILSAIKIISNILSINNQLEIKLHVEKDWRKVTFILISLGSFSKSLKFA